MAKTATAPRAGTGASSIIGSLVGAVRARILAARTEEALSRLTPAQREDIGLVGAPMVEPRKNSFLLALA